ncbi:uncharacterized protein AMSG_06002 [Thecamonas trahens ATCC 50062]|uniref:Uncharacterized protein n=1 Tax=Thecamonas trahens ATCC 50062 TaxID=461836 RepID=A0A0L0DBL7_THETB|nr:hypothetical protein AMSG_06002 [Thecamonas trahens ATCC 50062]KNC49732.1 hypothetical protein AMSG_06002 [Thecamonas trahens ATCC 50062]|eukprot:XP_013757519.1 hypothetical protein AMSG_06002 [Thecamonas trahens ATCC 50062]
MELENALTELNGYKAAEAETAAETAAEMRPPPLAWDELLVEDEVAEMDELVGGPGPSQGTVDELDELDEVGKDLYASMVRAAVLSQSFGVSGRVLDDSSEDDDEDVADELGFVSPVKTSQRLAVSVGLGAAPFTPTIEFGEHAREELHDLRLKCHAQRVEMATMAKQMEALQASATGVGE